MSSVVWPFLCDKGWEQDSNCLDPFLSAANLLSCCFPHFLRQIYFIFSSSGFCLRGLLSVMQDSLRFRRPRMKKSLGDEFIESSNWQMKRRWSQLSPLALAFVGGYIVVVYLICQRLDAALPTAIPVTAPLNRFSEGRARPWLDELTSFGPRPSGSPAAEVLAVNFILAQLEELRQTALVVGETLELSIQRPSGCFSLDFLSDFSLCYRNITNIAVRLKGSAVTHTSKSLLINCHFDSVPDSPGKKLSASPLKLFWFSHRREWRCSQLCYCNWAHQVEKFTSSE